MWPPSTTSVVARNLLLSIVRRQPVKLLAVRSASSVSPPPADWTKQSWATLSHIPERIQIEGTDPNARVNEDHSNIEFVFPLMSHKAKDDYYKKMMEVQKKDWKELTLNERKAIYYIAFGPYGPRRPILPPGSNRKIFMQTIGVLVTASLLYIWVLSHHEKPRTMTREWQEASNEMAKERNMDPITGVASEGYKGKGHIQS